MNRPIGRRRGFALRELVEVGIIEAGDTLVWTRKLRGERHEAKITKEGGIRLGDGRVFVSPSGAAAAAANVRAYDGWWAWRVGSADGPYLGELRRRWTAAPDRTNGL